MKELLIMLFVGIIGLVLLLSCATPEQKTIKEAKKAAKAAADKKQALEDKVAAAKLAAELKRLENNDTTGYTKEEMAAIMANRKLKSDADTRFWLYCLMGVGAFLVFLGGISWVYASKEKGFALLKAGGAIILIFGTASYYLVVARMILAVGALIGIAAFIYIQYRKFKEKEAKEKYHALFGQVVDSGQQAKVALAEHPVALRIYKKSLAIENKDIKDEVREIKGV